MNKMSSFERVVYNLLVQEGFSFIQEKQFKDCYNGYYRFDFYIPSLQTVVEVNGLQHYQFTKVFYKNKSDFSKAQERDRRKISYCLAHDIKIYCIPCWEIETLKTVKDIFSNRFLACSKFHNDRVWREHQKD